MSHVQLHPVGEPEADNTRHFHIKDGDEHVGRISIRPHADGGIPQFKMQGVKSKHLPSVVKAVQAMYGPMNKALATKVPKPNRPPEGTEIELDHDRRRVKAAIARSTGQKLVKALSESELPKVATQAPASAHHVQYNNLKNTYHGLLREISSRPVFHKNHDHAAIALGSAELSLSQAFDKMHQTAPTKMDSLRNLLGMKPAHALYMRAAEDHLRTAAIHIRQGDKHLAAEGRAHPTEFSEKEIPPSGRAFSVAAAHSAGRSAQQTPGAASRLVSQLREQVAVKNIEARRDEGPVETKVPVPRKPRKIRVPLTPGTKDMRNKKRR